MNYPTMLCLSSNRGISQHYIVSARRLVTRVANDACRVVNEATGACCSWVDMNAEEAKPFKHLLNYSIN